MNTEALEQILTDLTKVQAAHDTAVKAAHLRLTEEAIRQWPSVKAELWQWHEQWLQDYDTGVATNGLGHHHNLDWWQNAPAEWYKQQDVEREKREVREYLAILSEADPAPTSDELYLWCAHIDEQRAEFTQQVDRLNAAYGPALKRLYAFIVEGCRPCAFYGKAEEIAAQTDPEKQS